MRAIEKRYEFVLLFDVENGNPNGDPDAGNMPRIDAETGHGIVTDVCIKRKIRNYIELLEKDAPGFAIYVKEGAVLNNTHKKAYDYLGIKPVNKELPKDKEKAAALTKFMCENYFDIRAFGAVMSTEVNCGTVRGPIQLGFARSIDPIFQQDITITRMAVTKEADADKERTMGKKYIVPYGLYRMEGYVSAELAQHKTGFSEEDLKLLWRALENMFEHDRSAARGKMATRALIVFEHESSIGNAPAHKLFDKVQVKCINTPPRAFSDYEVLIDETPIKGVSTVVRV